MPPKRKNQPKRAQKPAKTARQEEEAPVFVSVDGPKTLGSLPQVPMNVVCSHLASVDDFMALRSLRKVNRGCKTGIDAYFELKTSIPAFHSITINKFQIFGTSFHVELRLRRDSLPLHSNLSCLRMRIIRRENEDDGLVRLTIAVRNRRDPVVEAITEAIGSQVGVLNISQMRNLEEFKFICAMFGEVKIKELTMTIHCPVNDEESSTMISFIEGCAISRVELHSHYLLPACKNLVERLVKSTRGAMYLYCDVTPEYLAELRTIAKGVDFNSGRCTTFYNAGVVEHVKKIFMWGPIEFPNFMQQL